MPLPLACGIENENRRHPSTPGRSVAARLPSFLDSSASKIGSRKVTSHAIYCCTSVGHGTLLYLDKVCRRQIVDEIWNGRSMNRPTAGRASPLPVGTLLCRSNGMKRQI